MAKSHRTRSMIFSEFKSILTAIMFELKYQTWKQKNLRAGRKTESLKNRPLCKITTKHIVLLFGLRLHFCCKGLSQSKNHIWNQVRNGCTLFRTEKTWRNVFRSHTQSERWFAPRPQPTVKKTWGRPKKFIWKQLNVCRARPRTEVQCWKKFLSQISIQKFFRSSELDWTNEFKVLAFSKMTFGNKKLFGKQRWRTSSWK